MTTHLFAGYADGTAIVVTSGITLCCRQHTLGLPKGDQGAIDPEAVDCPALESPSSDECPIHGVDCEAWA